MTHFLRLLLASTLLSTTLLTTSCEKATPVTPAPKETIKAMLSGQILPAHAVEVVSLLNAEGKTVTTKLSATGTYSFADQPVGLSYLSYKMAQDYYPLSQRSITVAVGGTYVPPYTCFPEASSASFSVDGTVFSSPCPTGLVQMQAGTGTISSMVLAFPETAPGTGAGISLYLTGPVAPGRYPLTPTDNRQNHAALFTAYDNVFYEVAPGSAPTAPAGYVDITALNPAARVVSGTFSFTAVETQAGAATPRTRTVSGTFTRIRF